MPTVTLDGLPEGHPLLAGAIALQLLTLELMQYAGTNPDLIRREQPAYKAAAAAAIRDRRGPPCVAALGHGGLPRRQASRRTRRCWSRSSARRPTSSRSPWSSLVPRRRRRGVPPGRPHRRVQRGRDPRLLPRARARHDVHRRADRRHQRDRPRARRRLIDGERPGALQWVGIGAALIGVMLASLEPGGKAVEPKALQARPPRRACHRPSLVFLDRAAEHDALTGVAAARPSRRRSSA